MSDPAERHNGFGRPTSRWSLTSHTALVLAATVACGAEPRPQDPATVAESVVTPPAPPIDVAAQAPDTVAETPPAPDLAQITRLYEAGTRFGYSRDAVEAALGPPDSVVSVAQPNRHVEGVTDTAITWHHGAFRFSFLVSGYNNREFLIEAQLRHPDTLVAPGIHLGRATQIDLERALGPPAGSRVRGDTTLVYYNVPLEEMGASDLVVFVFLDGTLVAVRATPYVD